MGRVMRRAAGCGIVALVWAPVSAVAQQSQPDCSGTVAAQFGGYLGRWRVESQFRGANGQWEGSTAVATMTAELSGCLLREEYSGSRFGEPYAYVALWGANGLAPTEYQRTFAHSQHGLLTLRQGRFVGDTLVLRSTTRVRGTDVMEEDRITRPTSSTFVLTNRRSTDGGASWTMTRRSEYFRFPEGGVLGILGSLSRAVVVAPRAHGVRVPSCGSHAAVRLGVAYARGPLRVDADDVGDRDCRGAAMVARLDRPNVERVVIG